ncbi:hypothetical protein [Massilia sp. BJB1822]|uniref:hypothetical protein n=1 Tax=Massilia sp. BJB1822 TaxID=2744470 RepID=UPI001592EC6F|nr:hypothetical protein [Massilia sp. BJB1822]NVD99340.1 hypothetical protein [Massilia sp. BJB1822]
MDAPPTMYELLIKDPDDVLGGLSYIAYKQHKLEFLKAVARERNGPPTQEELSRFYLAASTPAMLAMYMQRAKKMSWAFFSTSLEARAAQLQDQFTSTTTGQKLELILKQLAAKRTFKGWLADSLGNLAVNFLTILLIASAVYGFRALDRFSSDFGRQTGVLRGEGASLQKAPWSSLAQPVNAPGK